MLRPMSAVAASESTGSPAVTIDELVLADEPERWSALGFAVMDGCCQLGSVRLRLAGAGAGRGLIRWSLRAIATDALDGLPTVRSDSPRADPAPAPAHPNGALAIEAWEAQDWDLIFMDINMPVMDGVTAARRIRSTEQETRRPRTPKPSAILTKSG